MIARIFSLVAAATFSDPFTTRETVTGATPASLATTLELLLASTPSLPAQDLSGVGAQLAKHGGQGGNESSD